MENKYEFFYSFVITNRENCNDGIPFHGKIIATSLQNAIDSVKSLGNGIILKMNKEICNEKLHITHGLFVNCVEVSAITIVDDWGDCHDKELRDCINSMWCNTAYRNLFKIILSAYWERDKEELGNRYDSEFWWEVSEMTFEQACEKVGLENIAEQLLSYILDDADYKAIINYIRPNGWEELV